jgi:hypothetical protein
LLIELYDVKMNPVFTRTKQRIRSCLPDDWIKKFHTGRFLWMQRTKGFEISSQPIFDAASTGFFLDQIKACRVYLEYGSGGSTIVAAEHVDTLVSVDSDKYFLRSVRKHLEFRSNQDIELIHANIGLTKEWGTPILHKPTHRRAIRWANYSRAPWPWLLRKNLQPDLILVDGRFRVACVLECVSHIRKPESCRIFLDDYRSRNHYHTVQKFCNVLQMEGRMCILQPKINIDRSYLLEELEKSRHDYR